MDSVLHRPRRVGAPPAGPHSSGYGAWRRGRPPLTGASYHPVWRCLTPPRRRLGTEGTGEPRVELGGGWGRSVTGRRGVLGADGSRLPASGEACGGAGEPRLPPDSVLELLQSASLAA